MALVITHDALPLAGSVLPAGVAPLVISTSYPVTALEVGIGGVPLPVRWEPTGTGQTAAALDLSAVPPGPVILDVTITTKGVTVARFPASVGRARPGPDNTGGPAEADLEPYTGPSTIRTAGLVLEGYLFTKPLVIEAPDVQLRHGLARPTTAGAGSRIIAVGPDTVLADFTIDGTGGKNDVGVGYGRFLAQRLDVFGVNDGFRPGSGAIMEDSWVHHLTRRGELHPDCVQLTGARDVTIRGNTLQAKNPTSGDLCNAAIQVGAELSPTTGLVIEDNLMSGGNYTVNVGRGDTIEAVLRRNVYAGDWRYGPFAGRPSVTPEGDVTLDGKPIRVYRWPTTAAPTTTASAPARFGGSVLD